MATFVGEVWRGIACGRAGSICTCNVARLGTRVGRGMVVCGWEGGGAGWAWPCEEGIASHLRRHTKPPMLFWLDCLLYLLTAEACSRSMFKPNAAFCVSG